MCKIFTGIASGSGIWMILIFFIIHFISHISLKESYFDLRGKKPL